MAKGSRGRGGHGSRGGGSYTPSQRVEALLGQILKTLAAQQGAPSPSPGPSGRTKEDKYDVAQQSVDAAQRRLEILTATKDVTEDLIRAQAEGAEKEQLKIDLAGQQLRIEEENLKIQVERLKQLKEIVGPGGPQDVAEKMVKEQNKVVQRITKELREQKKEHKDANKERERAKRLTDDILGRLGPQVRAAKAIVERFKDANVEGASMGRTLKAVGKNLKGMGPAVLSLSLGIGAMGLAVKLVGKFVSTTKELVLSADALSSQFVAITGDTGAVRMAFVDLTMSNLDLAISFEKAMEAQLALREGFDGFLLLSPAVKASLTLHTATMERLGVDSGTTAENFNVLNKTFGMSVPASKAMQREMIGLATALELPVAVMMDRLTKTMPLLAEFGDNAADVFRRLTIASRETGLSVDEITSTFGDALNSYEASTKVAGQLNQVLGAGVISGTELLMADTEERFQMVQDALELTGRSFNDLGRWEKISFAQAAGFDTVNAAARAFNNTQDDIATRIGDTAISQERMNELVAEGTDSMTQLKFAMLSFAVALKPVIEGFAEMVDKLVELGAESDGGLAGVLSQWVAAFGVVAAVAGTVLAVIAAPGIATALAAGGAAMGVLAGIAGLGGMYAASAATGGITPRSGPGKHVLVHPQEAIIPLNRPEGRAALAAAASGALDASTAAAIGAAVKEAISPLIAAAGRAGGTGAGPIELVLHADTRELGRFIKEGALDAAGGDAFAPV